MEISEIKTTKDEKESDLSQANADEETFVFEYLGSKLEGQPHDTAEYITKW